MVSFRNRLITEFQFELLRPLFLGSLLKTETVIFGYLSAFRIYKNPTERVLLGKRTRG